MRESDAGPGSDAGGESPPGVTPVHDDVPPQLLACVAAEGGGLLTIVTGAGSSMEWPTGLKSGADYSEIAFDALVADGLLDAGACSTPRDLSKVADAVFDKYNSQGHLTDRLPRAEWRNASPNEGHKIAAALLIDGTLRSVVTLNYDLAFQAALSELGAPPKVTVAKGPEEHSHLGGTSLIYLHRSAESDPESWVLRKEDLDNGWVDGWEAMIAAGALSAPTVVFAGLGSPAAVLTDTAARLAGLGSTYFLADPYPGGDFEVALQSQLTATLRMGWLDLMRRLSLRVSSAHAKQLELSTRARAAILHAPLDETDDFLRRLAGLGVVQLGELRSSWLLHSSRFCPRQGDAQNAQLADLLLALVSAARTLNAEIEVRERGECRLNLRDTGKSIVVQCAHGQGLHDGATVLSRLDARNELRIGADRSPILLAAGLAPDAKTALPVDLVEDESDPVDLVRGPEHRVTITATEILGPLLGDRAALLEKLAS